MVMNMKKKTVLGIVLAILIVAVSAGAVFAIYNTFKIDAPQIEATPTPAPTPTATPEPTPEPTPTRDYPDVDITSWEFLLANPTHDIGDYAPPLATLEGQQFDERIIDAMTDFVEAARVEGLSVYLSSGYRDYATQSYLYQRKIGQYGEEVAKTIVAPPGTSEHQTGLACDITDRYYEFKDSSLEDTELYQWMSQHCQDYGFIVRFPNGKGDITGIIYEPWHFRYVGVEAATYIMEHDLCLEEFLELYNEG